MAHSWQARHGLTSAQYQEEINLLPAQGFRLIDVNGYSVNGVAHYAAVWEQSPGPAWQARHGISSADHQSLFDILPSEGFRPVCVSGYDIGGEARFASLWEKTTGAEWHSRHGLTGTELQAEFDALTPRGFRPVDVCGYTVAGQTRFAAIWDTSPMSDWVARHGLSTDEYQSQFDHWTNHGYVLWRASGYDDGGETRYAAIWNKDSSLTWQARHSLPATNYQMEFDAMLARGFRLVKVNGFAPNGHGKLVLPRKPSNSQSLLANTGHPAAVAV